MKKILSIVLLMAFSMTALANAADAPDMVGPEVGKEISALISLKDQTGTEQSLKSLQGSKGTVLVFFRSADWCPYCQMQLIDLQLHANKQIQDKGYSLAAVSYDSVKTLDMFTKKWSINFPLLSDTGSKVIDALKLKNPEYKGKSRFYGVPYPMVLVIDTNGIVKAKLFEKSYRKRPAVEEILSAL
ncbi:peroxiredoxin family protein [Temperatibacter marinus]|uniref:thioredoxin-dependent peroxiredoxin n=1 Tax=Temperatibacter marinus TaxID=1456591 RepID=A0AA52H980_9PROT|nr:peroxiredoxin family protein [Temperatibacter marinus]WND01415.1 peroxiredoxin family protein [Temperatibacter marinus]